MLPLSSSSYEQFRDGSLTIRVVTLRSLGPYTCQVYNGYGRATSQTIVLRALGPVESTLASDRDFLQYIVDPPKAPSTSPPVTSAHTTLFPAIPPGERPYRPSYYSPSLPKTTEAPAVRAYIGEVLYTFTLHICILIPRLIHGEVLGCRLYFLPNEPQL